ncbi:MAG: 1-deoxy-D-xylulose-5-phosphate reductoisomerase [Candidatus Beckwithbacteria bacterium]|nr:1-deoxy-D-xylulose-5-phosphate reductoisomerase [Candidatus Beckwithbacteria bacterium]
MKKIAVLGSTGVIGSKALEVVRDYPEEFKVVSLAAGHESEKFKAQIKEFKPEVTAIGKEGLVKAVSHPEIDLVIVAVVGTAGIKPTLGAIKLKKNIGLATKEVLVVTGEEVMREAKKNGVEIIPIDSEHSAIFQSLKAGKEKEIKNIYLTMGQGKISQMTQEELEKVTPEMVLQRKTWTMGQKISVDSATCINKAMEIIEAKWLFNLRPEQIKVLIHPEYLCHSMVEFVDGSVIAELGVPEMKRYVEYAMFYPQRREVKNIPQINLAGKSLSFKAADLNKFSGLRLGYLALEKGGRAGEVLHQADEAAVAKFLKGEIKFTQIVTMIETEMKRL